MGVAFFKELRKAAPADIFRQEALLGGKREPVLILQLFQKLDGSDVAVEPIQRRSDTEIVVFNVEVKTAHGWDLRIQQRGRNLAARSCCGWRQDSLCFSRFLVLWRYIFRKRIAFLKGEHILSGLSRQLCGKSGLPQHFIHSALRCDRLLRFRLSFLHPHFDLLIVEGNQLIEVHILQLSVDHVLQ